MSPSGGWRRRAVIFDVDGTLVDSERDGHRVAFNAAFAESGLPHRWSIDAYGRLLAVNGGRQRLEHYLREQGLGWGEAIELAGKLHRRKTRIFTELVHAGRIPARRGVERLLRELAEYEVECHVVTTGRRAWVEPLLSRLFGDDTFDVVVTGEDVEAPKPDPAGYLEALRRAELLPGQAVAVEDSVNGFAAARAAGLRAAVVTNPYTRRAVDATAGAAFGASSFTEVGVLRLLAVLDPPSPRSPAWGWMSLPAPGHATSSGPVVEDVRV